jgi:enoyl-[acyl-carrier protein] reductase III
MSTQPFLNPGTFADRRALVTGASRGIGAVIARMLAAYGAHVFLNYSRDEEGARGTLRAIEGEGGAGTLMQANLVNPEDIGSMFQRIGGTGLDVLVHNAALGSFKPVIDVRPNQWDLTMSVTARALLLCARHAVPLMCARGGGQIVSVSSLGSSRVVPQYGAIGASKAALEALTRYLAVELAPAGIRVNAVSGGPIDTAVLTRHPGYDALMVRARQAPAGRLGRPEDLARVVLFLCSPLADWIVGQTIIADGGLSLQI